MTCLRTLVPSILCCVAASAATIQWTQEGWEFGGPLTVSFTGQDSNRNGQIDQAELSAFTATYRTPQGRSITWMLGDLEPDGFSFSNSSNFLVFATSANYTLLDSAFQGQARGTVVDQFLFPVDITENLPAAVPEPTGLGCAGAACAIAAALAGKRRINPR